MRIAQLIECDGPGGAERIVSGLARTLARKGHEVVVFVPEHGEGWLGKELSGANVAIEYFRLDRPLDPGLARRLAVAFHRHGIQLAHSHEFTMSVYGAWAAWGVRIPHIQTMHGGRYHAGHLRRRLAMRAAADASRATVAVSESVADRLSRDLWLGRRRITVIPNGVPQRPSHDSTLREELGLDPLDRLVLAVGNLYPVKGHRYLIEATALLRAAGHRVHVAIAGRGEEERSLRDIAAARGVTGQVHLLGLRSDVGSLLEGADLFALPSLSEGLPLALLEAMCAGCAIVASDVGEVRVALADGTAGRIVPPGDAGALASALGSLLAHPEDAHELAACADQRGNAEYTIDRMAVRYEALYRTVLINAPAAVPRVPRDLAQSRDYAGKHGADSVRNREW